MFRSLLISFLITYSTIFSFAQVVKGTISDPQGDPVPDAYVYSGTSDIHAHTDLLGNFKCYGLTEGDTITISYIGFKTINRTITASDFNTDLEIKLEEANYELAQVSISNSFKSIYQVANIDLKINPVKSSQEVLRKVPGLHVYNIAALTPEVSQVDPLN